MTPKTKSDAEPMTATPDDEPQPVMPKRGADDPKAEIALRTGDSDKKDGRFRRVFSIPAAAHGTDDDDNLHKRNSLAVLEQAIQQGLHPTGDVALDSAEPQSEDEVGYDPRQPLVRLTYSVDVTPAALHEVAGETRTPGRVLEDNMGGSTEHDRKSTKK